MEVRFKVFCIDMSVRSKRYTVPVDDTQMENASSKVALAQQKFCTVSVEIVIETAASMDMLVKLTRTMTDAPEDVRIPYRALVFVTNTTAFVAAL